MTNPETEGKDERVQVTADEFRRTLRKQLDRANRGEPVEITRHGEPIAVLTPIKPAA